MVRARAFDLASGLYSGQLYPKATRMTRGARGTHCVRSEEAYVRTRFSVTFFTIALVLLALYYFPYKGDDGLATRFFAQWLRSYTHVTGAVVSIFDRSVCASGNSVVGHSFSMQIVKSCDAMEVNILFLSAMMAVPAPWPRKIVALGLGLLALVAVNILRLCSLFWIGSSFRAGFSFAHYDAWPLLLIAFAAADFLICARWTSRTANAHPSDASHRS
jgi:exosortase/archaeosortase family protein